MTLGNKISKLRLEKGLSQKELATILNKKTTDIALWESDEVVPSLIELSNLSDTYGISTDELLRGVEIDNNQASESGIKRLEDVNESEESIKPSKKNRNKRIKLFIAIIVVLLLVGIITTIILISKYNTPFSDNTDAIAKAASSVVKIYCYDMDGNESATGSGFIAFDAQTVITNYHVIEKAYSCKVSTDEDKTLVVEKVLCYSKDKDIAILHLKESTGLDILTLGNSDLIKKGETVTAIGSPLGIKNTISQGVLSGRIMEDGMDVLQYTAEISSGSSGGALINESGEVIGITYASYEKGQNINLAIPVEIAIELYNQDTTGYSIDGLYIEEHPYIKDARLFSYAKEVSLQGLKESPLSYDKKYVKIVAYVSSVTNKGGKGTLCYITDQEMSISNNDVYDDNIDTNNNFENTNILYIEQNDNGLYSENNLTPGDVVCIIGQFHFTPQGTEIKEFRRNPDSVFGKYVVVGHTEYSSAFLRESVIYKVSD